MAAIVSCSLVLWYWDMQGIHRAWGQFGRTLGVPPSSMLTWRQPETQDVMINHRWDFLRSDEPLDESFTGYPMGKSQKI